MHRTTGQMCWWSGYESTGSEVWEADAEGLEWSIRSTLRIVKRQLSLIAPPINAFTDYRWNGQRLWSDLFFTDPYSELTLRHSVAIIKAMATSNTLDELFDSVGDCLTFDTANKLNNLAVPASLQEQLDDWADRNSLGQLSGEDLRQYEATLRTLNFIAVLQGKARKIVAAATGE